MLSEVQCPECGVVLTLPSGSEGRKLKCPNCARIFVNMGKPRSQEPPRPARPGSDTAPARPKPPAAPRIPTAFLDEESPRADGPLRDLFDARSLGSEESGPGVGPAANDALALFRDDPPPRKRIAGGDARRQARRCPTCGGVVPVGMSLCATCGLDLDTGTQVGFADDLAPAAAPLRSSGVPLSILLAGGPCLAISIALSVLALVGYQKGTAGAEFLGVICLFGVYASVSFLRLRSVKLLLVALTLGLMVDVVGMIVMPAYEAYNQVEVRQNRPVDDDEADLRFTSMKDQMDVGRLTWGIAIIFVYVLAAVYLNSPPVRKHFKS